MFQDHIIKLREVYYLMLDYPQDFYAEKMFIKALKLFLKRVGAINN